MRTLKLIFSGFILIALAIIAEITFLVLSLVYWSEYYYWLRIVIWIMVIIVFLHLANKRQAPEAKIPWFVILMAFPLFGVVLYLLISNNKPTPKQLKVLRKSSEELQPYMLKSIEDNKKICNELNEYIGIENYLCKTSYLRGYINNKTDFLASGELFLNSLLIDLKNAKDFIFMEYFIIENGQMWQQIHEVLLNKVKEGIEIRIIYDDMGTAGKLSRSYYKKLRTEGIKCYKFNTFRPIISGTHNNRDHRKITIIDGKIGYTGGINLADEYINKKKILGYWKDSAIRVEGNAVANMTAMFLQLYDVTSREISDYNKYLNIDYPTFSDSGYVHPFSSGPYPYYIEQVAQNTFINMINLSKSSIFITTPYLIIDHQLTMALRNAAIRGIDVRIITPHKPDKKIVFGMTRASYKYLLEAGVKIFEYTPGFIHAKQILIDDKLAFIGSINLDYRSLVHHYECGIIIYNSKAIKQIEDDFNDIIKVSNEQTLLNIKNNKFYQLINALIAIFRPLF